MTKLSSEEVDMAADGASDYPVTGVDAISEHEQAIKAAIENAYPSSSTYGHRQHSLAALAALVSRARAGAALDLGPVGVVVNDGRKRLIHYVREETLFAAMRERDAAVARVAELKRERDGCRHVYKSPPPREPPESVESLLDADDFAVIADEAVPRGGEETDG